MLLDHLAAALPPLLRLYWILATFAATVALLPLKYAQPFKNAVLLSACRGKLMDVKPSHALGALSDATVPQSWFAHFYAIGALANTLISMLTLSSSYYLNLDPTSQTVVAMVLLLLEFHLIRRFVETVFFMKYPPGAKMHVIAYVFGISYYLVVPLSVLHSDAFSSIAQNIQERGLRGALSGAFLQPKLKTELLGVVPLMGIILFLIGNALQFHSHYLLAQLTPPPPKTKSRSRKPSTSPANKTKYKIPRGGAFEYVSCPHYFAEIVIYLGLAILGGGFSSGPWMMLAWVVANLILAGRLTHEWYRENFKTYPKRRKALIPFVY